MTPTNEQQEIKSWKHLSECELRQKRDDMIEFDKAIITTGKECQSHEKLIFAIEGILAERELEL